MPYDDFSKALARQCRDYRVENGLSQAELASLCGLGERTMRNIELAKAPGLSVANLFKVLQGIGLDIAFPDEGDRETQRRDASLAEAYLEERARRRIPWENRSGWKS